MGRNGWLVASLFDGGDDRLHPLAAADQRIQCRHHHRNRTVPRGRYLPGYGFAKSRDRAPFGRAWWRWCGVAIIVGNAQVGSETLGIGLACVMALAIAAMTVMVRRHRETSMVAAAAISNFLTSVICIPFAHGITGGHRRRPVDPRDVRVLSGRAGADDVLARLAPAAIRPGCPDLDAGNAADAVLDLAGVCRGARLAGGCSAAPW